MHNFRKVRTIRGMGTVSISGGGPARSRIETIVDAIIARIERGAIRPGERLPSIRGASELFGASKNTIVDAYERLVASGQIESQARAQAFMSRFIVPNARRPSSRRRSKPSTASGCCASNSRNATRSASATDARPRPGWKVRKSVLICGRSAGRPAQSPGKLRQSLRPAAAAPAHRRSSRRTIDAARSRRRFF